MQEKANAQTQIIERDIAHLRQEFEKQTTRFDRHLEIYAQNGKELSALKQEVASNHKAMLAAIASLEKSINAKSNGHVPIEEFKPVKSIVYGMVALVMTAVVGALLTIVLT